MFTGTVKVVGVPGGGGPPESSATVNGVDANETLPENVLRRAGTVEASRDGSRE